jgi:hypothetical protein
MRSGAHDAVVVKAYQPKKETTMNTDDKTLQMIDELLENVDGGNEHMSVLLDSADEAPAPPDITDNPDLFQIYFG